MCAMREPAWTPFLPTGQVVHSLTANTPDGLVYTNSRYLVVVRKYGQSDPPSLIWLSIKRLDNAPARDWRELQKIKNELAGPEAEAVELFPAESRLVDCANQTHLWCFPGYVFPFGFMKRLVSEGTEGCTQRPFDPDSRPTDLTEMRLESLPLVSFPDPPGRAEPIPAPRFPLGEIVIRPGAEAVLLEAGILPEALLLRHQFGDFGEIELEDRQTNETAIREGHGILSAYPVSQDKTVWVITDPDRSKTVLLLSEEEH